MSGNAPLACLWWPQAPVAALARLRHFSPNVADEHGLFWLDAKGLVGLYASQQAWAEALVAEAGGSCRLLLGHHAVALRLLVRQLAPHCWRSVATPAEERTWLFALPLRQLALPQASRQLAARLGFTRLAELEALPVGELRTRLDAALAELVAALRRPSPRPAYVPAPTPCLHRWIPDFATHDASQLLFVGKNLLQAILAEARARRQCLAALSLVLTLQRGPGRGSRPSVGAATRGLPAQSKDPPQRICRLLTAARPGNDARTWLVLLRLWLEKLQLPAAVAQLTLAANFVGPSWRQAALWSGGAARDVDHAHAALAKVRALWGEGAVVCASLQEAHLPEQRFVWTPLAPQASLLVERAAPTLAALAGDPLRWGRLPRVRRVFAAPRAVQGSYLRRLRQLPQLQAACLLRQPSAGLPTVVPAFRLGPYSFSHGWWQQAVDRDYVYAYADGQMRWLYFDRQQRTWFWHGTVD